MEQRIIIHKSKRKAILLLVAGVLVAGASYLCFSYGNDPAFGWIFAIAALLILILGVTNLRDRKPYIVLTARSITDGYTLREEIEWEAIVQVDDFFFRGQYFVRIILPANYKPATIRPTMFWRLNRIYEQQGYKAVYIRVSGLELNAARLSDLIENMALTRAEDRNDYLEKYRF